MLLALVMAAAIVAGEVPDVPALPPSPSERIERVRDYVKRCESAGGLTVLTFDDEEHAVRLGCVAAALRRLPIDTTEDK